MLDYEYLIHNYNSIYIQGSSGCGKTTYLLQHLKLLDYQYKYTYIQKIKNDEELKAYIENQNIMKCFFNKKPSKSNQKKVIIIDNIDYLNNNDKKILSIIIKLLKSKSSYIHKHNLVLILMGINNNDKKVLELCQCVSKYISIISDNNDLTFTDKHMKENVHDLIYQNHPTKNYIGPDKTIIALCYHENIIYNIKNDTLLYEKLLKNICDGDYYDRISFQKQLWQFNEMTYFIKVLHNYDIHGETMKHENGIIKKGDIIFTKILTKYSNEYSNHNFINNICNRLNIQKCELWHHLKEKNDTILKQISNVELNRLKKFI